jgi:hypothetical protein
MVLKIQVVWHVTPCPWAVSSEVPKLYISVVFRVKHKTGILLRKFELLAQRYGVTSPDPYIISTFVAAVSDTVCNSFTLLDQQ